MGVAEKVNLILIGRFFANYDDRTICFNEAIVVANNGLAAGRNMRLFSINRNARAIENIGKAAAIDMSSAESLIFARST